jgi:hypothetical protein
MQARLTDLQRSFRPKCTRQPTDLIMRSFLETDSKERYAPFARRAGSPVRLLDIAI